eukprot:TRINITY_DN19522_c0_g1_i1.p1 TRINITY_DN19522_c0_g1~~TRINITY_DN19522_c0_g1_i1.p1  ORF type:complete len:371 (+),score=106.87 TRINITY_DN19522_c0_g1_i1:50-1162(+)
MAALALAVLAAAAPLPSLRALAPAGMHMGAAFHYYSVQDGAADAARYAAVQAAQYGMAQDKNCMNWAFVEYGTRGVWRWGPADAFVDWCGRHAQRVRGHALIWPAHLPKWFLEAKFAGRAELETAVNASLTAMVGRYAGRVYAWHVVMEPWGDPHWGHPVWNNNTLYAALGERYVAAAFEVAKAADPAAKLCVLDYQLLWGMYGGVSDHAKADLAFGIIQSWKDPASNTSLAQNLDCVCMESHLEPTAAATYAGYAWLRRNFDRYHALGVEVHLNAVTISVNGFPAPWSEAVRFEAQARWYTILLAACVDSPACVDFETYGFTDKYDMGVGVPGIRSLPFDKAFEPKPAFWAMVGVLNGTVHPRAWGDAP